MNGLDFITLLVVWNFIGENKMKDYSQTGEQQVIFDYFGPEFKGTFLDIGANDGVTFSNTYGLSLKGWRGVCVEPCLGAS